MRNDSGPLGEPCPAILNLTRPIKNSAISFFRASIHRLPSEPFRTPLHRIDRVSHWLNMTGMNPKKWFRRAKPCLFVDPRFRDVGFRQDGLDQGGINAQAAQLLPLSGACDRCSVSQSGAYPFSFKPCPSRCQPLSFLSFFPSFFLNHLYFRLVRGG